MSAPQRSDSYGPGDVPDLLVMSILCTLFCCQIGGIVAIVYASGANSAREAGNYALGAAKAKVAKTWLWVSVFTPFLLIGLWLLLVALGLAGAALVDQHG